MSQFDREVVEWVETSNVSSETKVKMLQRLLDDLAQPRPVLRNHSSRYLKDRRRSTLLKRQQGKEEGRPSKRRTRRRCRSHHASSGRVIKGKMRSGRLSRRTRTSRQSRGSGKPVEDEAAFKQRVVRLLNTYEVEVFRASHLYVPVASEERAEVVVEDDLDGTGIDSAVPSDMCNATKDPTESFAKKEERRTHHIEWESPADDSDSNATPHPHTPRDNMRASPLGPELSVTETTALMNFAFGNTQNGGVSDVERSPGDAMDVSAALEEDVAMDDTEDRRLRKMHMKKHSRPAISAWTLDIDEACTTNFAATPKSGDKVRIISSVLQNHFLFSFLDDSYISKVAAIMNVHDFAEGDHILTRGELNDTMFLILSGNAEGQLEHADGTSVVIGLQKKSTCGDICLLYESKCDMTVTCLSSVTCATLDGYTYKMLTSRAAQERRQRYNTFLTKVPFLSGLTDEERSRLAESLKEDCYHRGDRIVHYGETGNWLHIVVEGTVDVIGRNDAGEEEYVCSFKEGDCCGDLEFLYRHKTVADLVASSEVVKTAKLSRRHFDRLIGRAREILEKQAQEEERYSYYRRTMRSASAPPADNAPPFDEPPGYLAQSVNLDTEVEMRCISPEPNAAAAA